jgi:DNA-binding MarR family transcriptional regulator
MIYLRTQISAWSFRGKITQRLERRVPRKTSKGAAASVLRSLRRVIRTIHSQSAAIEANLGLTGPQLWALREIDRDIQGLPLIEIASHLAIHPANAGRLVDRLVAKRLVKKERPANDRRYVVARITEAGRQVARRPVKGPVQADLLARLEELPADTVERIALALADLVSLLGAEGVEPSPLFEPERDGSERPRRRRALQSARSRRNR